MKTKYHLLYLQLRGTKCYYEPKICYYEESLNLIALPIESLWVNSYDNVIEIRMDLWATPYLIPNPNCSFFHAMPKRYCS